MNNFLHEALDYANERWCWDDVTFITEAYEFDYPPSERETPKEWIDWMADKFDLTDPRSWG